MRAKNGRMDAVKLGGFLMGHCANLDCGIHIPAGGEVEDLRGSRWIGSPRSGQVNILESVFCIVYSRELI